MRIGVLGAGFMGSTHARAYRKIPGVELVGVTSRQAEKARALAAELGTQPFTDPAALIADPTVDAIDICLPTPEHPRYAIAALEAGKHVLVEKPIALTLEDAEAIRQAHRRSGRLLMVGHVLRFWPEYVAIHDFVTRGEIGRPFAAQAWRVQASPSWSKGFIDAELTGGAVVDLMIHDFDLLNWLFGRPRSVYAQGLRGPGGGWDHVFATVSYDEAAAAAEGSLLMKGLFPFSFGIRLVGEHGTLEYAFRAAGQGTESLTADNSVLTFYPESGEARRVPVEQRDGFEAELAYFVECVRTGAEPTRASPDDAYRALEVALAVRRSLETGALVHSQATFSGIDRCSSHGQSK